jgi:D-alanyl-lipoteichoic acid acyltransferase DltB (MBOAT superfamily)
MRPFRSFLLLLIFLVCLTWVFDIFPVKELFSKPSVSLSPDTTLISDASLISDTVATRAEADTIDPLVPFLDSLSGSKGQVRVMYYGDSQVEGDRITFYLRQLLREGRRGTGPGLFLPVMPVMYTKSIWIRSSANWERYNYLSYKSGKLSHNNLGPFMTICRYLPEGITAPVPQKADIRIRPSNYSDTAAATYEIMRIFYSLKKEKVNISITGDYLLFKDTLRTGSAIHELTCDLKNSKEVLVEFEGRVSPDIYGISIESREGVIVDNLPQRGSAGLEFTMVNRDNLEDLYSMLKPDLIILHYGLNIVKNVKSDYTYYKRGLIRQLTVLKEMAPSTPVLLIGVTDMAQGEVDSIRSYANIPSIVKAQKEAAMETGAAFWDSYSAMGGSRSIVNWAGKKPPLAQNDYVHFTYPGADTLALMLNKAMFTAEPVDTLPGEIFSALPDTIITVAEPQISEQEKSTTELMINRILSYDPDKPFIFTIPAFWLFLLILLAGYGMVYRKIFLRNFYLLIVSLFFYYKTGGLFLILLVLVTIIDFTCGYLIFRSGKKGFKRLFILFSLLSNLGILAYFKYTGFIVGTINDLAGTSFPVYDFLASFSNNFLGTGFNVSNIILPAGISFFTFQSLSYTIDIYRGRLEPVKNIVDFGFYVSFFPQLVAGPIVRASEFIPQLYAPFSVTKREFGHALFKISKGLIKKIVISDFIAVNFVDRIFDVPSIYSGFENLMAVYGYGLQIYCDFSGYTDIALGVALILGFRLPINFNSPYKAAGISDFWKRWHISLSRWLKDYLYISLGGNRKGKFRTSLNLLITMLLGGLWHGASIRFVIWGGLHGIGLIVSKIWDDTVGKRFRMSRFSRLVAVFITFNFVNFCWIFFRAPDLHSAFLMITQIFENFSPGSYLTVIPSYASVFLLMAAGYLIHFLPENIKESYRGLFIRMPLVIQLIVVMMVAVLLLQMRTTDVMPFIYFRF